MSQITHFCGVKLLYSSIGLVFCCFGLLGNLELNLIFCTFIFHKLSRPSPPHQVVNRDNSDVNMVHADIECLALKLFWPDLRYQIFFYKNIFVGPGQFWWPLSSKGASGEEIELDCCVKISRTNCRKHRAKKSSHPRELRLTS